MRGDPAARVLHRYSSTRRAILGDGHRHQPVGRRESQRVIEEVADHPAQPARIAGDQRPAPGREPQGHPPFLRDSGKHLDGLGRDAGQIDRLAHLRHRGLAALGEQQQVVGELGEILGHLEHVDQRLAMLRR